MNDPQAPALEGRAAMMLVAALVDSLERAIPGTNAWIDKYLVEALSRRPIDGDQRDAIQLARELLAGLREGLPS